MHGTTELYSQYHRLIWYAANMYSKMSSAVDREDLFQDSCVKMFEYFEENRLDDDETHNRFKKNLFFWVHRLAIKQINEGKFRGRTMIRLDDKSDDSVNVDDALAYTDVCVLTKMYAKEFVNELRRLLTGWDRAIFEMMVESVGSGESRTEVVKRAILSSGYSRSFVYNHMSTIRQVALQTLSKSA